MKSTLVLGASPLPYRYSFLAAQRLQYNGHKVYPLGRRGGKIADVEIETNRDEIEVEDLDTITVYLSARNQQDYYDWMIEQKPKRVIFNPGAENPELADKLQDEGIEVLNACTLVMLSTDQY